MTDQHIHRKFSSIFIKIMSFMTIILMLPMGIVVWVASFSFNAFIDQEIDVYSNKSLSLINSYTTNMISNCLQQMNYISNDDNATVYLISEPGQEVSFYDDKSLFKLLAVQMRTKDYLSSIYIYSDRNDMVFSNYGLTRRNNFFDAGWYDEYKANEQLGRYHLAFRDANNAEYKPAKFLSIYKFLGYTQSDKGVLVFNINFPKFVDELSEMRSSYDACLFITDSQANVIADVWGNHDAFTQPVVQDLMSSDKNYVRLNDFVLYRAPIQYTDWFYVFAVPYEIYQSKVDALWQSMSVVIFIGFMITVILAIILSIRIYQPYKRIINTLQEPASPISTDRKINSKEESLILNTIRNTINENAIKTNQLNERVLLLKKAQSIALQSQINPHFLYNTLDTINWSAMRLTGGKNQTSIMISNLAHMIRYSLDSADNLVPLAHELENIRLYLNLQGLRYQNKFTVQWEVEEETTDCKVLKLILQPLIENAIYHGIKPVKEEGLIKIRSKRNGANLEIMISDNGAGINKLTIKQLNEAMNESGIKENEHIGLMNVNQRIKLFFGDAYGLTITSEDNQGTTVTIRLPCQS